MTSALDPLWELDLSEEGIEYDNEGRTVRDLRTGESVSLGQWMVLTGTNTTERTVEHKVWVRAAKPPTIGTWHKVLSEQ